MIRFVLILAALAAIATPAAAQQLDGVWYSQTQFQNGLNEYELVVSGNQYALSAALTSPEGYRYQSYQSGAVEYYPPDAIRLVVHDYEPKVYMGNDWPKPPNQNLRVVAFDGQTMTLLDTFCAQTDPTAICSSTYQKVR